MATERPKPRLPISIGTPLLVDLVNLDLRLKSELVGMGGKDYLIIKFSHNAITGSFRSKQVLESPLVVRYLYDGTVFGFESMIENVVSSPAKVAFIGYPTSIEEHNTRTSPRYDCVLPAVITVEGGEFEGVVVDLSANGCRCVIRESRERPDELSAAFGMDTETGISINLPGVTEKVDIKGLVRNITHDSDSICFGVMFADVAETARAHVEKYLSLIDLGTP